VSLAAAGAGHIDWTRGLLYVLAQVRGLAGAALTAAAFWLAGMQARQQLAHSCLTAASRCAHDERSCSGRAAAGATQMLGGFAGAAMQVVLQPGVHFGEAAPGCHLPVEHLGKGRLFGWEVGCGHAACSHDCRAARASDEAGAPAICAVDAHTATGRDPTAPCAKVATTTAVGAADAPAAGRPAPAQVILTTFFIMVMLASDFVRPGHGDAGPLAAGLALYAILSTGACAAPLGRRGSRLLLPGLGIFC
jgi:hypothetical protein